MSATARLVSAQYAGSTVDIWGVECTRQPAALSSLAGTVKGLTVGSFVDFEHPPNGAALQHDLDPARVVRCGPQGPGDRPMHGLSGSLVLLHHDVDHGSRHHGAAVVAPRGVPDRRRGRGRGPEYLSSSASPCAPLHGAVGEGCGRGQQRGARCSSGDERSVERSYAHGPDSTEE